MKKEILLKDKIVYYDLQYKNVKNLNLRIKSDGSVFLSVNKRVSQKIINEFLVSKSEFILKTIETFKNRTIEDKKQYFSESQLKDAILKFSREIYPHFEIRGIKFPQIRFRKMSSCWGCCHPQKSYITFNTNLMFVPAECVRYVVIHEFTHFLVANHSKQFYDELSAICPEWKEMRRLLKTIVIN